MKLNQIFLVIFLLSSSSSYSNGIGIVDGTNKQYLETLETHTSVYVKDQIAIITTTQVFRNQLDIDAVFKYGFPLKEKANPTSLRWKYMGVWKSAEVSSGAQDPSIPGGPGDPENPGGSTDPELTDYLGEFPFFFTPRDTVQKDSIITVELTYVELLPYFLGKVSFYQKNDFSGLQPDPVISQSLEFTLESDREVLDIELTGLTFTTNTTGNQTLLNFVSDEQLADFDYLVEYELASNTIGINAISTFIPDTLFNCDEFGNGYFTFIIEPESNVNTDVIEKNFCLVIDRSGSMGGNKIEQAKDAANYIVQNLNPGDNFNIIDFNNSITSLSPDIIEYNVTNENEALAYIDNINASGSTNISGALERAINQFTAAEEDKANIIIFLTDGNPTAGIQDRKGILDAVANQINATETEVFLFTIGIGADLDQALLTLLARENNGLVKLIDPYSLEVELVRFFLSVNNPVLLNTNITIEPNIIDEIYPYPFPNLYKGQQLILSGRYPESDDLNIHLAGKAFNVPVEYNFQVSLSDTTDNKLSFLPKVWAKQKLDALSLDFYLQESQFQMDSISTLIDSLSRCYGVIAIEFTSFEDPSTTETDEIIHTEKDSKISVYPSPCTDHIVIKIEDLNPLEKTARIKIFNWHSELVITAEKFISDGRIKIDGLENLEAGIYFVLIELDQTTYLVKFLKI